MSFLLCHDCYTWVEPLDNRCPECLLVMDFSAEDPAPHLLREVMGDLAGRLGEVRIPRKLLPEWGTLYATTDGLFFVPHEMDHALRRDDGQFSGTSLMWSLGSLIWSPLFFLSPLVRSSPAPDRPVRVLRPRYLSEEESAALAEFTDGQSGSVLFAPAADSGDRAKARAVDHRTHSWRVVVHLPGRPGENFSRQSDPPPGIPRVEHGGELRIGDSITDTFSAPVSQGWNFNAKSQRKDAKVAKRFSKGFEIRRFGRGKWNWGQRVMPLPLCLFALTKRTKAENAMTNQIAMLTVGVILKTAMFRTE